MNAIDDQLVRDLIRKYVDAFSKRFPFANIEVHFTENGLPPLPPGIKRDAPKEVFGASIKAGDTHLIGIHRRLKPPARLSTFFHEYGHAIYKIESNEDDSEGPGLVRSETAAMLSSLCLPADTIIFFDPLHLILRAEEVQTFWAAHFPAHKLPIQLGKEIEDNVLFLQFEQTLARAVR